MLRLFVLLFCCLAINAQLVQEAHPAPEPYNFAYSALNEDGSSSSREEAGDANGRVTGFYTLVGEAGQQRRVEYVADENGFRAVVTTNEIGTESKDAADAQYLSSAPTAAELVAQWEASGAGRARLEAQRARVAVVAPRPVVQAVGVAPATRVQAIRTAVAQPVGVSLVGGLRGGLIGSQAIRTQTLGGLGIAGVLPAGVIQTAGLQGLTLNGLRGSGANLVLVPGNAIGTGGLRLVPGGLQLNPQGRVLLPQALSSELVENKS